MMFILISLQCWYCPSFSTTELLFSFAFTTSKHFVGRYFETIKISHPSSDSPFVYFYPYRSRFPFYLLGYNPLPSSFILMHELSQIKPQGLFQADSCVLMTQEIHRFLNTSLLCGTVRYFRFVLYISWSRPRISHLLKESFSLSKSVI